MTETTHPATGYYAQDDCSLEEFKALCAKSSDICDTPHASRIEKNVPIYEAAEIAPALGDASTRRALMAEWARVLMSGAGIVVIKQAATDLAAIDAATAAYLQIIEAEKAANGTKADHFAAAGANDRIWNALQKLCLTAPETFARSFANPSVDAICEAWLGPNYQMTAQVNLVHPGGQAQQAHRDYHLGFQSAEVSALYPAQTHELSPLMTLQGGIAHCDMSLESGPTKLLPFSQAYKPGYAAWRRPDFRAYFEQAHIQLPLNKGDALFFSPALFHAAGENRTQTVQRFVNLLQISSPFGRAMESIDRAAMCKALYPVLAQGILEGAALDAAIAATAEGYSFPTNLDTDPPIGGLAPETQAALMRRCLAEGQTARDFDAALDVLEARKRP